MSVVLRDEGRSPSLRKRRFYARYMRWLEWGGYGVVTVVIGAFVYAFTARVDDVIAADGVELAPASTPILASGSLSVVRRLVSEGAEVRRGEAVLEIVEGTESAVAYRRWAAAREIGDPALLVRFPAPATRRLLAPRAGTFRSELPKGNWDGGGVSFGTGDPIGRIVDYGEVTAQASLAGDTASRARAGGEARLTNLEFPNPDGATLRAVGPAGRGNLAGRSVLDPGLRNDLQKGLVGKGIRLKSETLTVAKVTDVEVQATFQAEASAIRGGMPLDLAKGSVLRARVLSGTPVASAQLVNLPPELAGRVRRAVAALAGREVVSPDGDPLRIIAAERTGVLVKVKAEGLAPAYAPALPATPLKLTFDADLRIVSPPPALVRALREADRDGKPITCRVELVTGTRPLAFLLLKRS